MCIIVINGVIQLAQYLWQYQYEKRIMKISMSACGNMKMWQYNEISQRKKKCGESVIKISKKYCGEMAKWQ